MKKMSVADKQRLKELRGQIKALQASLVQAEKLAGKDPYIEVKLEKNQAQFKRVKHKGSPDTALGIFFLRLNITAEQSEIYIPLSIASGKKVAGVMYQIEGTAAGTLDTASVRAKGKGLSQITVGTLLFAKVPASATVSLEIRATIRGSLGKTYKLVFSRLNYKLQLGDQRYQQYLKAISSKQVKLA